MFFFRCNVNKATNAAALSDWLIVCSAWCCQREPKEEPCRVCYDRLRVWMSDKFSVHFSCHTGRLFADNVLFEASFTNKTFHMLLL